MRNPAGRIALVAGIAWAAAGLALSPVPWVVAGAEAAGRGGSGAPAGSARLWVGENREAIPRRIAVAPGGASVFVTGSRTGTHGIDDFWDYFTASFSAADGSRRWTATFDGRHGGDTAEGLGVSPDGTA